ncbi:MAG TPA: hypothetical protein VJR50_22430 [Mycobacterium sp.]|nr:hypothetical protein [Mycobacterium sp.]
MAEEEGGRWDVGVKDNVVYLARLSNDGERLFDEQLEAHEARQLGELLTKYAARADEADTGRRSKDDDDDDDDDDGDDDDEKDRDDADADSDDDDDDDDDDDKDDDSDDDDDDKDDDSDDDDDDKDEKDDRT